VPNFEFKIWFWDATRNKCSMRMAFSLIIAMCMMFKPKSFGLNVQPSFKRKSNISQTRSLVILHILEFALIYKKHLYFSFQKFLFILPMKHYFRLLSYRSNQQILPKFVRSPILLELGCCLYLRTPCLLNNDIFY